MTQKPPAHPPIPWSHSPRRKNSLSSPRHPRYLAWLSGCCLWASLFFGGCASRAPCGPSIDRIEPPYAVVEFDSDDFRSVEVTGAWIQHFAGDRCAPRRLQQNTQRVLRLLETEGRGSLGSLRQVGL